MPTFASETNRLFNANEFSVSVGSGYVVDTAKAFQADYSLNFEAGAAYFLTENFGLEGRVPFYQTDGVSVYEARLGGVARLPIKLPVGEIAPYIGIGGVYSWQANTDEYSYRVHRRTVVASYDDKEWAYTAKIGVEGRINSKWGVYTEAEYRNTDFELQNGAVTVLAGFRLVF